MAIAHANRVLGWYADLAGDEMPPVWMWPFDDELKIWFEQVDTERKAKYGGDSNSEGSDTKFVDNELAAEWRRGN